MRIEAVELRRLRLPLVAPFAAAHGTTGFRDALLVRVRGDAGEGWAECSAPAEPTYTEEYAEGARHVLRDHLVPRVLAAGDVDVVAVGDVLRPVAGHRMAKAALEVALLDAELRAAGTSLAAWSGATAGAVECGVAVGMTESTGELVDEIAAHVEAGYRRVKLKVRPGWDVLPLAAVRERFPDVALQVDANGSYPPGDLDALRPLDEFGLLLVEQPYAPDRLLDSARLAAVLATPVCLDESVVSAASAVDALALGACSVVCLKHGRVGGCLEALRVHDACHAAGAGLWCGGMLETGLGRAVTLALAALPGVTLPADLSPPGRWFRADVTEPGPFAMRNGCMRVPDGPGLGVQVDAAAVEELTAGVEEVRRR